MPDSWCSGRRRGLVRHLATIASDHRSPGAPSVLPPPTPGEGPAERQQSTDSVLKVASLTAGGEVRIRDQLIEVMGDAAYEIGRESGHMTLAGEKVPIEQRVTNIYRRKGGEWKMVHHHADPSPAMLEVLERIPSGT